MTSFLESVVIASSRSFNIKVFPCFSTSLSKLHILGSTLTSHTPTKNLLTSAPHVSAARQHGIRDGNLLMREKSRVGLPWLRVEAEH